MRAWRHYLLLSVLATVYFVAGRLGLALAFVHPSATPVWAPTGIALAAVLILGSRVWPALFVGAFFVNLATQGTVLTSLGIAAGNTLEGVVGAYLVTRWAAGQRAFDHARSAFLFVLLAAGVGTTLSASVGVTSLALGGFASWTDAPGIWITWWLGDVAGALVLAPALLLWGIEPRVRWDRARAVEAAGLALAIGGAGFLIFSDISPIANTRAPSEFITMPVLMWAAFRFGPREAATAVLALSGLAIVGTLAGQGPFVWGTPNGSLLLLQAFMCTVSATTLIVAAAMTERRAAERQLQEWSINDPLTGLANYRKLVIVLQRELQRSDRTGRPFALLLLDLDRLKAINDQSGHLVGSRAICRVAEALRGTSRAFDTAARFGGDEFAVVMPESDEVEARALATRVAERLAQDREAPPISASVGVAVCPRDGETVEALIGAADQRLYEAKRQR